MKKITEILPVISLKPQMTRVAAYIRVSTSSEVQLESLDAQETHFKDLLNDHHSWKSVGIYVDEGISGTKMKNRPGIQKLLQDCIEGKIDLVLTKSISRFSRNAEECLEVVRELNQLDVAIYFEKEEINTQQMDGELLLSVLSSLAESESKSISDNVKWSIRKRIENDMYKHIVAPYGYKIVDGKYEVDQSTASIIQDIFSWYLSGLGTYRIAKRLNEKGVPCTKGKQWWDSSVKYILTNVAYVGDFLYQKTYTDDNYKRHPNEGDVDQLLLQSDHPAIINRSDFNKVQELMSSRAENHSFETNKEYILSRKIVCGQCQHKFIRRTHYSTKGRSYIAWTCSKHLQNKRLCSMKFVKEKEIQETFMLVMNKLIFGRKEIVERTIQKLDKPSDENKIVLQTIEKGIQDCQEHMELIVKLHSEKIVDSEYYHKELLYLENEKKQLLQNKRFYMQSDSDKYEQIWQLKELNDFLKNQDKFHEIDEGVMNRFLHHITIVDRDKRLFTLKGGLDFLERRLQ
ncbi:recombinase family protein [Facklamia languida]